MTELLYLPDNDYAKSFDAVVTDVEPTSDEDVDGYVVLNKTLFYKEGGGQPADHGSLTWNDGEAGVVDVQKDHGDIKHYVTGSLPSLDTKVEGEIDWERRHKHMRMHTAQHLLSWVVLNEYGASTAGNQIHESYSRIDFAPVDFDEADERRIEALANEYISADLGVEKREMNRDDVERRVEEGRTNLDLIPSSVDPLRVVIIGEDDICPCGGTHVDSLGDIGEIHITERVNKGADTERIKFELGD